MKIIAISLKTKEGKLVQDVDLGKLIFVLSKLENNVNLEFKNEKQIYNLLDKYDLLNEEFLLGVNQL